VIYIEQLLKSLELFKSGELESKVFNDLEAANAYMKEKMIDMFAFILKNDFEVAAHIAV
jgi:hypothetical protein